MLVHVLTEVDDFDVRIGREKDVVAFYVSVDHLVLVQVF